MKVGSMLKPSPGDEAGPELAAKLGCAVLEALERKGNPPFFLPLARALIFYDSVRIGLGFGVEYGKGFMISR